MDILLTSPASMPGSSANSSRLLLLWALPSLFLLSPRCGGKMLKVSTSSSCLRVWTEGFLPDLAACWVLARMVCCFKSAAILFSPVPWMFIFCPSALARIKVFSVLFGAVAETWWCCNSLISCSLFWKVESAMKQVLMFQNLLMDKMNDLPNMNARNVGSYKLNVSRFPTKSFMLKCYIVQSQLSDAIYWLHSLYKMPKHTHMYM